MQTFLHQLMGSVVTVEMAGRESIYGKVRSVSEDTLVLETGDGEWAVRLMHITAAHHKKEQAKEVSASASVLQETNPLVVPSLNGMGNSGMTVL